MSAETKAALDEAIATHFADEFEAASVRGYVLQIVGASLADYDNGQESLLRVVADGQQFLTTFGLATYMERSLAGTVAHRD